MRIVTTSEVRLKQSLILLAWLTDLSIDDLLSYRVVRHILHSIGVITTGSLSLFHSGWLDLVMMYGCCHVL